MTGAYQGKSMGTSSTDRMNIRDTFCPWVVRKLHREEKPGRTVKDFISVRSLSPCWLYASDMEQHSCIRTARVHAAAAVCKNGKAASFRAYIPPAVHSAKKSSFLVHCLYIVQDAACDQQTADPCAAIWPEQACLLAESSQPKA